MPKAKDDGSVQTGDPANYSVEIKKVKKSVISWVNNPDLEHYEYGNPEGSRKRQTHRVTITRQGKPTAVGWKLINLALIGKSWRHISRVTGIDHYRIAHIFHYNPVVRQALLELEYQLVQEASDLLVRGIRKVSANLLLLATGQSGLAPAKQRVQLEAIREYYNRLGFGAARLTGREVDKGDLTVRITGDEGRAMAILLERRRQKALRPPEDTEGFEEEHDKHNARPGLKGGGKRVLNTNGVYTNEIEALRAEGKLSGWEDDDGVIEGEVVEEDGEGEGNS